MVPPVDDPVQNSFYAFGNDFTNPGGFGNDAR